LKATAFCTKAFFKHQEETGEMQVEEFQLFQVDNHVATDEYRVAANFLK
jgi:hypothetical protein